MLLFPAWLEQYFSSKWYTKPGLEYFDGIIIGTNRNPAHFRLQQQSLSPINATSAATYANADADAAANDGTRCPQSVCSADGAGIADATRLGLNESIDSKCAGPGLPDDAEQPNVAIVKQYEPEPESNDTNDPDDSRVDEAAAGAVAIGSIVATDYDIGAVAIAVD